MKLYYSPGTCALADHIVLHWIGKPFETVRLTTEERKQPAYLAINPAGAVPTLEHDGWLLTQNVAILNYLAECNPAAALTGDGTAQSHAVVNQWLSYVNSDVHPVFKAFFGGTAWLQDEALIERAKENARKVLRTMFERLDKQLEGQQWLAGSRSIADPYLFVVLRWARATRVDLTGLDNLHAFFEHMRRDPGVRKALEEEGLD